MSREINEMNKLISEFMNSIVREVTQLNGKTELVFDYPENTYYIEELRYHSSWDWLMPVVEKISSIIILNEYVRFEIIPGNYVRIFGRTGETPIMTNVAIEKSLIQATWKAVIDFIQWYNKKIL